jgi:hypothetical protein
MNSDRSGALQQALWMADGKTTPSVWAVLDCARSPAVYRALLDSRLDFRCLYEGTLTRELELAAPHLVELLPGHRLTKQLIEEGCGEHWGVLLKIADPSNLRHHLRKLLKVRSADHRVLLFRFYDPRVLRAFLPTADALQLNEFFGPVVSWIAADGNGGMLEFRRDSAYRLLQRPLVHGSLPELRPGDLLRDET